MSETREQILEILAELAEIRDPARLNDDARLVQDLGLNSLMELELLLHLEQRLGIQVDERAAGAVRTVGELVTHAEALVRNKRGSG